MAQSIPVQHRPGIEGLTIVGEVVDIAVAGNVCLHCRGTLLPKTPGDTVTVVAEWRARATDQSGHILPRTYRARVDLINDQELPDALHLVGYSNGLLHLPARDGRDHGESRVSFRVPERAAVPSQNIYSIMVQLQVYQGAPHLPTNPESWWDVTNSRGQPAKAWLTEAVLVL